jgi:hypothetical protein
MIEFLENADGVHFMNPILGEFTLCGDSFDFQSTENLPPDMELVETQKRTVTCARCAALIIGVRRVRVAKQLKPHF